MSDGADGLRVDVDVDDDSRDARLRLSGEIDLTSAATFDDAIARALASKPRRLVADFADVTFIDSAGLSALVRASSSLDSRDALVIMNARPHIRRVLEVAGLTRMLTVGP